MIADRNGNIIQRETALKSMRFFYRTFLGRLLLKPLVQPWVSRLMGKYKDSGRSCRAIPKFIEKNHIDMSIYEDREFTSYNDFFTRKIKPGARSLCMDADALMSPCDCKLSVYTADESGMYEIKNSLYALSDLVGEENAKAFVGGTLLVFRLTVDDYHRYAFFDDGTAEKPVHIPGVFHTVNPIAMERYKVFSRNTREYTLLHTKNFGLAAQIEVGALMVGRIVNHDKTDFVRGEEKGYFEFGGSTVILLLQKGVAKIDEDILRNMQNGLETRILFGEKIGTKIK